MKTGLYGGAFNPVHNGHIHVAREVQKEFKLDKIIFVPAGIPRHRKITGTTALQRCRMVELGIKGLVNTEITDFEIKESERTGKPVATIDTVREFVKRAGQEDKLYFITGSDEAAVLDSWNEPGKLLELCSFIVVCRPGYPGSCIKKKYLDRVEVIEVAAPDISSSEIRKLFRAGKPATNVIPPAIRDYITKHGLYR